MHFVINNLSKKQSTVSKHSYEQTLIFDVRRVNVKPVNKSPEIYDPMGQRGIKGVLYKLHGFPGVLALFKSAASAIFSPKTFEPSISPLFF